MNLVVGSGPAGIACATALIAAGRSVTLLDCGVGLEPDRSARKARLRATDPDAWDPADVATLTETPPPGIGVPDKRVHGSDYPFRQPATATRVASHATGLKPSYALGGLSNVWGGAILPYRDADLTGWPIDARDLAAGYAAMARLLPLSARQDDLDRSFPLAVAPAAALPSSRQATRLLATMQRHRGALQAAGLSFGTARLAVEPQGCLRCGLCLHGCPRDLIYSTAPALAALQARGLAYRAGVTVRATQETQDGVIVHAVASDGTTMAFRGTRVFIGAGAINTTEILLRSLGWFDRTVTIRDAQYMVLPVATLRGVPDVEREALHTLCQAFLELDDPAISPNTIHMQAYGYNDMIGATVRAKLGRLQAILPLRPLLGRLMVLQSYLHSDHSGTIAATLRRDSFGERLDLDGIGNAATAPMIAALMAKLMRLSGKTGLIPLKALLDATPPGRGFHSGGSFPMALTPVDGQTDVWGRPHGLSRVHLVDSSIFPTIPAPTITLTVMANAYRIGARAAAEAP